MSAPPAPRSAEIRSSVRRVAGMLSRLAASPREVLSKSDPLKRVRTAGHRAAASVFLVGSRSAPRLCGDIRPSAPLTRAARSGRDAKPTTLGFHPRRVVRRPPRPDRVTPGARARLAAGLGPCCPAPSSGAATLIPRYRRSAARVLMDEGCMQCKRAARGGDN